MLLAFGFLLAAAAGARSLDSAARDLARAIEAAAGRREIGALTVRNASSLPEGDAAQVRRTLEAELRAHSRAGAGRVTAEVTLSENVPSYLWVAVVSDPSRREVVMLNVERPPAPAAAAAGIGVRKTFLWEQEQPILDAASGDYLIVLDPSAVSLYRNGQAATTLPVSSAGAAWRDPRGRLTVQGDTFRAILPDAVCAGTLAPGPPAMTCAESGAWLAPGRNYFAEPGLPPYFSAANLPSGRLLAGVDGRTRLYDAASREIGQWTGWGSDIAAVETGCGSGYAVLATKPGEEGEPDEIRLFDVSGAAPAPAGEPTLFSGPVTALWPASRKGEATAVARNPETGRYAAYSLAITCGR